MCRVIHASSFMSPAQSSPLQTLYFSLSLFYIWVGKGKEAIEEREREMNLPDCVNESRLTFTAGHKKTFKHVTTLFPSLSLSNRAGCPFPKL